MPASRRSTLARVLAGALLWTAAAAVPARPVAAQSPSAYPARAVKVVVPFPPGGIDDLVARNLSLRLSQRLGQNFYVENRAGASGAVGAAMVAHAAPDGYTLLVTTSALALATLLNKPAYDPVKSFAFVAIPCSFPVALLVNADTKADTVGELVNRVRKAGTATYASAGIDTIDHFAAEMFLRSSGLTMAHVPFTGAGPALAAVLGGQVPIAFQSLPSVIPVLKEKSARVLAVTSPERSRAAPAVPTFVELGFTDVVAESLVFILAPMNTPRPVVDKINRNVEEILRGPDIGGQFSGLGLTVMRSSATEAADRFKSEVEKWKAMAGPNNP